MSIVEKMQKDAELQRLRAENERLKSFEELYKAGCAAWNPTFKTILDERDALRAEVERLCAVLERISQLDDVSTRIHGSGVVWHHQKIALAALEKEIEG